MGEGILMGLFEGTSLLSGLAPRSHDKECGMDGLSADDGEVPIADPK